MSNKSSDKNGDRPETGRKLVTINRRARFEYEILETYEAGIVLVGTEVKSVRAGKVNIQDAFCRIENAEMWVYNMNIAPYEQGNRFNSEPLRKRKILLHRWQLNELRAEGEQKGLSIVPLRLYFERGFAKMQIGLARGKKLYDKRRDIQRKDTEREQHREVAAHSRG